jgi:hypothetical protein
MRRIPILLAALTGLLMAACAPANTPAPANTLAPVPSTTMAQATDTPQVTEPATAASQPEATKPVPAATPDIAKIIKAQPDDWKRGPADAKVTIIEWGDFQ